MDQGAESGKFPEVDELILWLQQGNKLDARQRSTLLALLTDSQISKTKDDSESAANPDGGRSSEISHTTRTLMDSTLASEDGQRKEALDARTEALIRDVVIRFLEDRTAPIHPESSDRLIGSAARGMIERILAIQIPRIEELRKRIEDAENKNATANGQRELQHAQRKLKDAQDKVERLRNVREEDLISVVLELSSDVLGNSINEALVAVQRSESTAQWNTNVEAAVKRASDSLAKLILRIADLQRLHSSLQKLSAAPRSTVSDGLKKSEDLIKSTALLELEPMQRAWQYTAAFDGTREQAEAIIQKIDQWYVNLENSVNECIESKAFIRELFSMANAALVEGVLQEDLATIIRHINDIGKKQGMSIMTVDDILAVKGKENERQWIRKTSGDEYTGTNGVKFVKLGVVEGNKPLLPAYGFYTEI